MREWFKARNAWGAVFQVLSDEQAGQLAKALWSFTADGIIPECDGYIGGLFAMMQITLNDDLRKEAEISAKRAAAGAAGGNQKAANQANGSNCYQMQANQAIVGNKNKNKSKKEEIEKEGEEETEKEKDNIFHLTSSEIADTIRKDQEIEDAARYVGLPISPSAIQRGRDLAEQYGHEQLIEAIKASVDVPKWAYVEGILRNGVDMDSDLYNSSAASRAKEKTIESLKRIGLWDDEYNMCKDTAEEYRRKGITPDQVRQGVG